MKLLYIASSSASRKNLLKQAQINFSVIGQDADESQISTDQEMKDIVMQIAVLKMQSAQIPAGNNAGDVCFVLTADTLGLTAQGRVIGKPVDRDDAISMLKDSRKGILTVTGFCLRKLEWQKNSWIVLDEYLDYDKAASVFDVSDDFVDFYLDRIPFLSVSGAISIEGFGGQFLKSVEGSYESVIGLPMFKIRESLFKFGFYE